MQYAIKYDYLESNLKYSLLTDVLCSRLHGGTSKHCQVVVVAKAEGGSDFNNTKEC